MVRSSRREMGRRIGPLGAAHAFHLTLLGRITMVRSFNTFPRVSPGVGSAVFRVAVRATSAWRRPELIPFAANRIS